MCLWKVSIAFEFAVKLCGQTKELDYIGSERWRKPPCGVPLQAKKKNKTKTNTSPQKLMKNLYQKKKMV